jgi:GNAT superfamily N-acetyltransferase
MAAPVVETLASITPEVAPMLDALVAASGWNQTARDWQLFARLGAVHVVRDGMGTAIASGAVLPMQRVAWIGMILVMPEARGRGLGRAVFAHCLDQVKRAGQVAMLDATPQGEPLYASFGFVPLWRLTRWQREPVADAVHGHDQHRGGLEGLAALDAQALGIARPAVLGDLFEREGSRCVRNGAALGLVRAGRVAHHIGPLLAADERAAATLLAEAAHCTAGRIVVDVPEGRLAMARALRDAGFTPRRGFVRMALDTRAQGYANEAAPTGQPAFIHAIAGPEFG